MDDEPATEILDATYHALCKHGYADLTLQDIAAESELSKAAIHYHYETKRALFGAFLDYLYERYTARIDAASGESPREQLRSLLDALLRGSDDAPGRDFQTAILEIKAQGPYDDAIRGRLTDFDAYLVDELRRTVAAGVEAGEFRADVDPAVVAELFATTVQGAHTRQVAVGHSPDHLYDTMTEYVETQLATAPTEEPHQ